MVRRTRQAPDRGTRGAPFRWHDYRPRRPVRAAKPRGAQLSAARRARWRWNPLSEDRRTGEGLLDGLAADDPRCHRARDSRASVTSGAVNTFRTLPAEPVADLYQYAVRRRGGEQAAGLLSQPKPRTT